MARRDRSFSPESSNKRVRQSYRSPRSPSPTRRSTQRAPPRSRYEDEKDRDRNRDRDRDRDRHRDDRYRDDRRRDSHRDERRRSRSRDRRPTSLSRPLPTNEPIPPEDEKLKAKRAKLEAWKKEREAKKALDEAKAKAMALAGKSVPSEFYIHLHTRHDFTPLDPLHSTGFCFCYRQDRWSTEPVSP